MGRLFTKPAEAGVAEMMAATAASAIDSLIENPPFAGLCASFPVIHKNENNVGTSSDRLAYQAQRVVARCSELEDGLQPPLRCLAT